MTVEAKRGHRVADALFGSRYDGANRSSEFFEGQAPIRAYCCEVLVDRFRLCLHGPICIAHLVEEAILSRQTKLGEACRVQRAGCSGRAMRVEWGVWRGWCGAPTRKPQPPTLHPRRTDPTRCTLHPDRNVLPFAPRLHFSAKYKTTLLEARRNCRPRSRSRRSIWASSRRRAVSLNCRISGACYNVLREVVHHHHSSRPSART